MLLNALRYALPFGLQGPPFYASGTQISIIYSVPVLEKQPFRHKIRRVTHRVSNPNAPLVRQKRHYLHHKKLCKYNWVKWVFIFLSMLAVTFPFTANANDSFGLAMHGAPKYTAKSTHLSYANPNAPKGGTLTRHAIGTFDTLNPYTIKGKSAKGLNLYYDRLMARIWDEPFTMYPLIAERYEMPEDRSSITFHINPAARFHDGSAITAEDVLFSFETLREFGRPNMRRIYKLAAKTKIIDSHTIYFEFGEGYDQETALIFSIMPVLSKAYWENKNFDTTTLEAPLSNGPYRILSVDPGRKITYERDPNYWAKGLLVSRGHYNFERIEFDYFRDDDVALEAFRSGDISLRHERDISKWLTAYKNTAQTLIKKDAKHGRAVRASALIFNMRRTPFNSLKVREALSLAFDEEWAAQNIYFGKLKRIRSYFENTALSGAAVETLTQPLNKRQRLRKADTLLKEAGWIVEKGVRIQKDTGNALLFTLLIGSPDQEKIALSYKKSLERLGIVMQVRLMDNAEFQNHLSNYDYDMVSYFWQNSLSPGTEQVLYWSCESANISSRWNFSGICDEELDGLVHGIADAQTYKDLKKDAQAIDRILLREHIAIPLFYSDNDHYAYQSSVSSPGITPLYGEIVETWWMDRE